MARIEVEISAAVWDELQRRRGGGDDLSTIVDRTLAEAFELDGHTVYQVSTAGALAEGVFGGVMTLATLEEHGDFGLGTFDGLDGELILIDGRCYRATYGGEINEVDPTRKVPYAVVTRFSADTTMRFDGVATLADLEIELDRTRSSDNMFLAIRGAGVFDTLAMRTACRAAPSEGLLQATRHQSEFAMSDLTGTIVGFWTPGYADQVAIAGYHFHFISDDRTVGGHVLDLASARLEVGVQTETSIVIATPNTAEFKSADLTGDHREAIAESETLRRDSDQSLGKAP